MTKRRAGFFAIIRLSIRQALRIELCEVFHQAPHSESPRHRDFDFDAVTPRRQASDKGARVAFCDTAPSLKRVLPKDPLSPLIHYRLCFVMADPAVLVHSYK
jgi:hypothetical protein